MSQLVEIQISNHSESLYRALLRSLETIQETGWNSHRFRLDRQIRSSPCRSRDEQPHTTRSRDPRAFNDLPRGPRALVTGTEETDVYTRIPCHEDHKVARGGFDRGETCVERATEREGLSSRTGSMRALGMRESQGVTRRTANVATVFEEQRKTGKWSNRDK